MNPKSFIISFLIVLAVALAVGRLVFIKDTKPSTNVTEELPAHTDVDTDTDTDLQTFIQAPKSPLGGARLLNDDKCLTPSQMDIYKQGIVKASKGFLVQKGLSESYFDQHFCVIMVTSENGYARVTYKATFLPYLAWWQHHFPFVLGEDKQPKLQNGIVLIDFSGKIFLFPQL